MTKHELGRTLRKPRTALVVIFGATGGLIATGVGGLFSWALYGASNPTRHVLPMIMIVLLTLIAGASATRVVAWLAAGAKDDRNADLELAPLVPALVPPAEPSRQGPPDRRDSPSASYRGHGKIVKPNIRLHN